jgi:hypothetical protein
MARINPNPQCRQTQSFLRYLMTPATRSAKGPILHGTYLLEQERLPRVSVMHYAACCSTLIY